MGVPREVCTESTNILRPGLDTLNLTPLAEYLASLPGTLASFPALRTLGVLACTSTSSSREVEARVSEVQDQPHLRSWVTQDPHFR